MQTKNVVEPSTMVGDMQMTKPANAGFMYIKTKPTNNIIYYVKLFSDPLIPPEIELQNKYIL